VNQRKYYTDPLLLLSITALAAAAAAACAGGISITPAMAVLQELAASTSSGSTPLPVLLVWSFRQAQELQLLCPPLLALAGGLRLQLTTKLFYTGERLQEVRLCH
jgi:hypothetical protein